MAEPSTYDVVVIGGGAVGENVADRAGRTGLSVVLVENELVGGECSYWACMPSKALLRPGAALAAARAVGGAAQAVTGDLDVAAVLERRDGFAAHWDDAGQVRWLEDTGISLVRGTARLTGERAVRVQTEGGDLDLVARHAVVVATGSAPVLPRVPGLVEANPWTSREATAAQRVPGSLAVLGGGVVGVEMATAMADLGSQVTVLVRGSGVLDRAEPAAGEAVVAALRARGVDVRLGTALTAVERRSDGRLLLSTDGGDLEVDELLVATGRAPRTDDLGLESIGLEAGASLEVDLHGRVVAVPGGWLHAAGDVTGRTATTHQGKYDARVLGDVLAARHGRSDDDVDLDRPWSRYRADADGLGAPQVVFTRPEVAWVGRTEAQARAAGLDVRVVSVPLASAAGAGLLGDDTDGVVVGVIDVARDVLVGVTFVGPDVAELLHAATVAVVGEVPIGRLWHAVPAYPTVSEVWLRLLEAAGR